MISSPNIDRAADLDRGVADDRQLRFLGAASPSRRTQFSTMITELSTTSPKSIAPRLMRLAEMPSPTSSSRRTASTAESPGRRSSPRRALPEEDEQDADHQQAPSARLWSTVSSVRAMSSTRS
jgi:hypothetical protein